MTVRVAFAGPPGAEADAAWAWLSVHQEFQARRVETAGLGAATDCDVLWLHADRAPEPVEPAVLAAAVTGGRRLVLTLRATALVLPMGVERTRPNDVVDAAEWRHTEDPFWTEGFRAMSAYPHVRGLATYGPHPLADGLPGGTYTWAPADGERFSRCCYRRGARPAGGQVVAVERAYVAQNPGRIVAWEYALGRGRVLCLGAYVYFAAPDPLLRPQLERLIRNALVDAEGAVRTVWPESATAAVPAEALVLPEPWDLDGRLPDPVADPIAFDAPVEPGARFDLAGRRALLLGTEGEGLEELWVHPHRIIERWEIAADGEPVAGTRVRVGPDAVVRTIETPHRRLVETAFVALEHPVAILDYHGARKGRESVGRDPPRLELAFTIDLRRMWPFAAGSGGNLRFRHDPGGRVALVESESGDGVAAVFCGRPCETAMRALHERDVPVVECRVRARLDVALRIAVVAGAGRDDLERTLRAVRRLGVAGLVRQRLQRAATVREARLRVRAPDPRLPRALAWAKRRLDLFLGDAPGVGRSLMAGYAPSGYGWSDGRPGHAWFFARDACWSSFALLATGEHSIPRQVLRFLGDTQDITGKVIHEVTTSGQHHYDAADSTPLFLLLVGRYLAWTGDREFIASIWPRVERALRFCVATDTDDDGLIENTRVGHGWLEAGPLSGAHVSVYLAAVWRAALEAVARAAEAVGEARTAADCWARAARAGATIEADFWGEALGGYALDKRLDGSRTWAQTALQSVALFLGAANTVRARAYLDALGGTEFNAPWGLRMLPVTDPHFNPESSHGGAVWPLFTGWAALAEYRAGRDEAGFGHLLTNAQLAYARQKGAFDDVLHGLVDRAAGVCSNQASAAAMVTLPLVEGLLGVEPDALGGKLTLAPALPAAWEWLDVVGLRCGERVLDARLRRRPTGLELRVRRTVGVPLWLTLAPLLPRAGRVSIDGAELKPQAMMVGATTRQAVSLEVSGEHEILFEEG